MNLLHIYRDKPNTPNSMISYSIVSGNEGRQFSVEGSTNPVIVLRRKLDYEAGDTFFNLTLKAEVSENGYVKSIYQF